MCDMSPFTGYPIKWGHINERYVFFDYKLLILVIVFYDVFELVCGFLVFCLIQEFVLIHMLADLQA